MHLFCSLSLTPPPAIDPPLRPQILDFLALPFASLSLPHRSAIKVWNLSRQRRQTSYQSSQLLLTITVASRFRKWLNCSGISQSGVLNDCERQPMTDHHEISWRVAICSHPTGTNFTDQGRSMTRKRETDRGRRERKRRRENGSIWAKLKSENYYDSP